MLPLHSACRAAARCPASMLGAAMRGSLPALLAGCALWLACGEDRAPADPPQVAAPEPPPAVTKRAPEPPPAVATTTTETTTGTTTGTDAPASTLEIQLRAEPLEQRMAPVVEVRGGTARLAKTIGVEREVRGRFQAVRGIAGLELRSDCGAPAPECVEVVAGTELRPPPWLGTIGDAQCICTRCWPAPAGTYRFVLHSCDGTQRIQSEPFTVSAR